MSAAQAEPAARGRGGRLALPGVGGATTAFAASAAAVGLLGAADGGYYATTWSIAAVAALAVGTLAALRNRAVRIDTAFLLPLVGFVVWTGIEATRSGAATRAMPELQRATLYLAVGWAAGQLIDTQHVSAALAGVFAAIAALLLDGLAHLLLPMHITADAFEGRLLFLPLGYANACAALAAIAIVLTLDAARARRAVAALLVPVAVALALTQSRGAIFALAAGLLAAIVLHPRRHAVVGRMLVLFPVPLAAAAVAAHSHVADAGAASSTVARDCVVVAAVTCVAAALQLAVSKCTLAPPTVAIVPVAFAAVAGLVVGATRGFGDRRAYWHVAWLDAHAHPLLGSGAGTFARVWLAHRSTPASALNAHSLYLETLAELGPLGLALLVAALAAPLVAAARRRSGHAAIAAGAYATFLAHAAVDWDWQMPAVTVAALLCGVCAMRAASAGRTAPRALQPALALSALLALAVAAAGIGNAALAAAGHGGGSARSVRAVRLAETLQPWSAEPLRRHAELAIAAGGREEAHGLLEQALRLDPDNAASWYDLLLVATPRERAAAVLQLRRLDPFAVRAEKRP